MPKYLFGNGITSVMARVKIMDSTSSSGAAKTGLTFSSSGLVISTIADNESTPTVYTSAGSTVETITTLGTYAAPTSTKCRFKEVDATNHPGWYEVQFADARYAVSAARVLGFTISGVTGAAQVDAEIQLSPVPANLLQILGTTLTETAGLLAGGFKKFFNIATPASTMDHLTLIDTATNLTNAAGAGDFTATQKTSITTAVNSATPAVTVSDKTGFSLTAPYDPSKTAAQTGDAMALTTNERNSLSDVVLTRTMTESYAADGSAMTLAQALYMIHSELSQFDISGTTITCRKLDGTVQSMTFGLDSSTAPTSRTRTA